MLASGRIRGGRARRLRDGPPHAPLEAVIARGAAARRWHNLVLLSLLGCASASGPPPMTKTTGSLPPEASAAPPDADRDERHLSPTARALISKHMQGHGNEMTFLLWSVIFLDYEGVERLSRMIASEPRFARPHPSEGSDVNALLPARYFALQDDLASKARALADLATSKRRNAAALVKAYGALAESCVGCHSVYLFEPEASPSSSVWEALRSD